MIIDKIREDRFNTLLKSFYASKIIECINQNPHELTDEENELFNSMLYFYDTVRVIKKVVDEKSKIPIHMIAFENYELLLQIFTNLVANDLLFKDEDIEIENVIAILEKEIRYAISNKFVNKQNLTTNYLFFQEYKHKMIKENFELAQRCRI